MKYLSIVMQIYLFFVIIFLLCWEGSGLETLGLHPYRCLAAMEV